MNQWMKVKVAGLPRWGWALMLTGAVGLGLYLRSRSVTTEDGATDESYLSGEIMTEPTAGYAAAGLVSQPINQLTPVETPYLPEGITDMMEDLARLAAELGAFITDRQAREIEAEAERQSPAPLPPPVTGGGPPPPPDHTPDVPQQPRCPDGTVKHIALKRAERQRLQGEIDSLQRKIENLTSTIKAHPNAKNRNQWERERNEARGAIEHKRNEVININAAIKRARAQPGCANA